MAKIELVKKKSNANEQRIHDMHKKVEGASALFHHILNALDYEGTLKASTLEAIYMDYLKGMMAAIESLTEKDAA